MKLASAGDKNVKSDSEPSEVPIHGRNACLLSISHSLVTYWCLNVVLYHAMALNLTEGALVETGTVALGRHEGKVAAGMWAVDVLATRRCDAVRVITGDALGTSATEELQIMEYFAIVYTPQRRPYTDAPQCVQNGLAVYRE